MEFKDLIKDLQRQMNEQGEKLTLDGDPGSKTKKALQNFEVLLQVKKISKAPVIVAPTKPVGKDFGAPYAFIDLDLLGLDETDPRLVDRYEKEWREVGLSSYRTLSGRARAWCSIRITKVMRDVKIKSTNSAGASSWDRWGRKSLFYFGCILNIRHSDGSRHVCIFLYWIDEAKGICATLDGNRGNKFCVARTDISGKGDTLVGGPRWSNELPDGQIVSMADVLKAHPYFKVGNVGGSTR